MARKFVTDSSDPEQVRAAELDSDDRLKDLEWILSTPRGRRWVYELAYERAHLRNLSFVPGDQHSTAFNEGARSVGEAVVEELRTLHFNAFIEMMKENNG